MFITSIERKEVVQPLLDKMACVEKSYMLDGVVDGFESWEEALAGMPSTEIADQSEGRANALFFGHYGLSQRG